MLLVSEVVLELLLPVVVAVVVLLLELKRFGFAVRLVARFVGVADQLVALRPFALNLFVALGFVLGCFVA